jgi:ABC-type transport system involved in cytochrome c biogenesis permease subunit
MTAQESQIVGKRLTTTGLVVVGGAILVLTYFVLAPIFAASKGGGSAEHKVALPAYDYHAWYPFAVQSEGRTKPFESACTEKVRQICGRARFERTDPVAIVLAWVMLQGEGSPDPAYTNWETYPFILCDHHGLRAVVYDHLATDGQPLSDDQHYGKYVSPADLRRSPGFDRLLKEAATIRRDDPEKAHFHMTTEQLKADEAAKRLATFDHICGRLSTRLHENALVEGSYIDLGKQAGDAGKTPEQVLAALEERLYLRGSRDGDKAKSNPDAFHFIGLDRVPGSAWLSRGDLLACRKDPDKWQDLIKDRLAEMPQLYTSPERLQALREFQERVKAGQGTKAIDELKGVLQARRDELIEDFRSAYKTSDNDKTENVLRQIVKTQQDREQLRAGIEKALQGKKDTDKEAMGAAAGDELAAILRDNDERVLKRLQQAVALTRTRHYHPDDPEFRMMHLDYLESRFPAIYRESLASQAFPSGDADRVLKSFDKVREAYRSGSAEQFADASQSFFHLVRELTDWTLVRGLAERHPTAEVQAALKQVEEARQVGDKDGVEQADAAFFQAVRQTGAEFQPYPGITTIDLELLFNRQQPFQWAWVLMLLAAILLAVSTAFQGRPMYLAGLVFYISSLALQSFGFFTRIWISGRPPVSNIYETVIWVAFMSAVFALVLELIYRRRVIALGGAMVATLGLVLADQMPLALDPKVSPLVPVLRSNYWLTVHVLTIVSSYAGGTLAWVMGNLTLGLLVFGKGKRETLKTLTQFTYRAMQIGVLLLAAGTFLGGWWAAESWGRFWGWDSKEVGALVALIVYVIPLHARFIGWVKDFGLAVCAVICYAAVMMSWYGINFVFPGGLHSYGFGSGGGPLLVMWLGLINIEWVLIAARVYYSRLAGQVPAPVAPEPEMAAV